MLGLMQDWQLTVDRILDHANASFPRREVVTRSIEGPISRSSYGNIWRRAKQITNALRERGVKLGDRTYKNHLDGYNQMDLITGKGPSKRNEIFYLGESTVGAVRIGDYKFRFIDQPHAGSVKKPMSMCPISQTYVSIPSSDRAGLTTAREKAHNSTSIGSNINSGALCSCRK